MDDFYEDITDIDLDIDTDSKFDNNTHSNPTNFFL